MCCKCCSVTQRKLWVFGTGSLILLLGIVLVVIWPDMSVRLVQSSLVLKNGSETFDNWVTTPIPVYTKFTLFNWTNPHEIRNPNVKPNFVEMGPYVFEEKSVKEDLEFHDNATISYYGKKTWYFVPELSNGRLDDQVTTAHVITATVADLMREKNKYLKKVLNFVLNTEGGKLMTTSSVREWIFDGYKDRLIDFIKLFNTTAIHMPYTKFGWLVDRNDSKTYDGRFMINSGLEDVFQLGKVSHWNRDQFNGFYPGECGRVNGSMGDLFPPNLDTNEDITIYAVDTCRFLNLSPGQPSTHRGIDGFEWLGTIETLDSGENYPDQQCFCNPKEEVCPKTGVVDCRKCRDNAPIYASFPHFYLADPSYVNAVTGLNPTEEKHRFRFSIEPFLGIPLQIHARVQINLQIQNDDDFDIYRGVPKILMPMFFFEQVAELDEKLAKKAKLGLNLRNYGMYFGYALIGLGALINLIGIVLTITKKWKSSADDDEELLSN